MCYVITLAGTELRRGRTGMGWGMNRFWRGRTGFRGRRTGPRGPRFRAAAVENGAGAREAGAGGRERGLTEVRSDVAGGKLRGWRTSLAC